MKLIARQDLDVAHGDVFAEMSRTDRWERIALRRGIEVKRLDAGEGLVIGANWAIKANLRGKLREGTMALTAINAPNSLEFLARSSLFDVTITIDMESLGPRKSRVTVAVDMKPNSLTARIMLQSMKLAKASLQKRYSGGVKKGLKELGERAAAPGLV